MLPWGDKTAFHSNLNIIEYKFTKLIMKGMINYTVQQIFTLHLLLKVNRVFLYVMDYANSEYEVRFAPSRRSLVIFSVQYCKIAKISTKLYRI